MAGRRALFLPDFGEPACVATVDCSGRTIFVADAHRDRKRFVDPQAIPQFGLVAEDVEKVNPDLVVRDKEGKPYSVRYDAVNAMLLNEFLKEHRKNEEQEAIINRLQKQIEALSAGLQKVSAQLEASKAAPQVVSNP